MNGKALIPLVAGLAIGGFALWMGVRTLRSMQGAQRPVESVALFAARETIPRGVSVTEEMLTTLPFPATLVPEGAFRDKAELLGRVTRVDAPGGLPILDSLLHPPGASAGLHVRPGFRAIAIKIDESSGVDYHLEPGFFVDLVGSFPVRRKNVSETLARTIVENVEIAAVGPRISAADSRDEGEKSNQRSVRAVTLLVKPEVVPKILLAEQRGKLKLSLRGDDRHETDEADRPLVSDLELTGQLEPDQPAEGQVSLISQIRGLLTPAAPEPQAAPPPPPPLPPPPDESWEVVVFRGNDKDAIKFKNRNSRELVEVKETRNGPSIFENTGGVDAPTAPAQPEQSPESQPATDEPEPNQPQEQQE